MTQLAVYLDDETAAQLDEAALRDNLSRSAWVREAIRSRLRDRLPDSFFAVLGTWEDERGPDEILRDIRAAGRRPSEPPWTDDVYLLDTDVCIHLLRGKGHQVARRLSELPSHEVGTTAITAAELRFGALRSAKPERNMLRVEQFLGPIAQLPFDERAGMFFARIKADLAAQGQMIGPMDLLIAATALSAGATLVTHNLREYERVPRLRVEGWLTG